MNSKKPASNARMHLVALLPLWTLVLQLSGSARAQLTINAITPSSSTDGSANTIMGTAGGTIASALLATGTPAIMWGMIPADSVISGCQQIVNTGAYTLSAHVTHNWGDGDYDLQMTVIATGGCLAAADGRGTELVVVDQDGRHTAIVCLDDASSSGCAVWVTGDDVNAIYSSATSRRLLSPGGGRKLTGCTAGGIVGAVAGYPVSLLSCFALYPTIVGPQICVLGLWAVSIGVGIYAGCSCFPGDALVQLPGGISIPMEKLAVGDKVAVWKEHEKSIVYEDIYAFGHKSATAKGAFVRLSLEPYAALTTLESNSRHSTASKELELTALHFVPTARRDHRGKFHLVHKRAQDIQIGDYVWAVDGNTSSSGDKLAVYVVMDVSVTFKNGLYNPLTMSGTIMVRDVAASVHSEWFLDSTFDAVGMSSMLPYAYQHVLSPVRLLYRVIGKQLYASLYGWLDSLVDVAEFGTRHGGKAFGFLSVAVMLGLLLMPWKMLTVYHGIKSTQSNRSKCLPGPAFELRTMLR